MESVGVHGDLSREGEGMRRAMERMGAARARLIQRERNRGNTVRHG